MTLSASLARSGAPPPAAQPMQTTRRCDSAVLVLRALGLGDAVTAIPALRGIRRAWPDRWVLLAADPRIGGWLRDLGIVDEVLPTRPLMPLAWPPPAVIGSSGHVAVNLHGRGPQSHRLLAATGPDRLVGFRQPAAGQLQGPGWRADEPEVDRWCRLVHSVGGRCGPEDLRLPPPEQSSGEVLLHPGAGAPARCWPARRWAALVAHLASAGLPVALTGGAVERPLCAEIMSMADDLAEPTTGVSNLAGRLTVSGLARHVARARLLVCGDTGVAHLATAYGARSVLLFGPTSPRHWGPAVDADRHTVLWHGDDDHPGDPHGAAIDPALASLTVDEVWAAVDRALAAGQR